MKEMTAYNLCAFVQWTWGLPQNILGFFMLICNIRKPHCMFRSAVVTVWDRPYSVGCGMFVFLGSERVFGGNLKMQRDTLVHEYGHAVQSLALGVLFIPLVALPSVAWAFAPFFVRLRRERGVSYYALYCESLANEIGDIVCGNERIY